MARCGNCGRTILFGGVRVGDLRFCNAKCAAKAQLARAVGSVPEPLVAARVWQIYNGTCSICGGAGPVNAHASYRIWSNFLITKITMHLTVGCQSCARRRRLQDARSSALLGWWALPWGPIYTPIELWRNLRPVLRPAIETGPSPRLFEVVRARLGVASLREQRTATLAPPPR